MIRGLMMFNPDLPNLPGDDTIQVNYSVTLLNNEVANLTMTQTCTSNNFIHKITEDFNMKSSF